MEQTSRIHVLAIVNALALASLEPALAQSQAVRAGGLTCESSPGSRPLLASRQELRCVFRSGDTRRRFNYTGAIKGHDFDFGLARGAGLFWVVYAPTVHVSRRAMRGNYAAAGDNAALSPGLGGDMLIGGSRRTIFLQPLSVDGLGMNLALGVTNLSLQ